MRALRLLILLGAAFGLPVRGAGPDLIVCGADEVFVIPALDGVTKKDAIWSWRAVDSPEIPEKLRNGFATTDECKPYGGNLLITSSSGGVALVRRNDKACLFYATSKNAHSACLLPGNLVAVASSFGADELRIYDLGKPGLEPVGRVALFGAHGVVWDPERKVIWALGTRVLLSLGLEERRVSVQETHELPKPGGHDLSRAGEGKLFVSVDEHCFRFDCETRKFTAFEPLADEAMVKSIDLNPATRRIVWHQGTGETWWSETIRFLNPAGTITLPGERLYKVRWDLPQPVPAEDLPSD